MMTAQVDTHSEHLRHDLRALRLSANTSANTSVLAAGSVTVGLLDAAERALERYHRAEIGWLDAQQSVVAALAARDRAGGVVCRLIEMARDELGAAAEPRAEVTPSRPESGNHRPSHSHDAGRPTLLLALFGELRLSLGGDDVALPTIVGTKSWHVLECLAFRHPRPVRRDVLIDAIWPDDHVDDARRRLHQAVYAARQGLRLALGDSLAIEFGHGAYRLRSSLPLAKDTTRFEELASLCAAHRRGGHHDEHADDAALVDRALDEAEHLYRADLLADLDAEWIDGERERLRRIYIGVATQLADRLSDSDQPDRAAAVWERVLARDPWHEAAVRGMMRCLSRSGQRSQALHVFEHSSAMVTRDLGVELDHDTETLYRLIRDGASV